MLVCVIICLCSGKVRERYSEVKILAVLVCALLVYISAIFALTDAQLLQNTNAYPYKLSRRSAKVSLKITCLVLTVVFPRKIHLFRRIWLLLAWGDFSEQSLVQRLAGFVHSAGAVEVGWAELCRIQEPEMKMQLEPSSSFPLSSTKITLSNAALRK